MKRLLILISLMVMVATIYGATRNVPYVFNGTGLDSVRSLMWEDSTLTDSISAELNSFPETGFWVVNDVNPWTIQNFFYWNGNSTPVTGSMTLDYRYSDAKGDGSTNYIFQTIDTTGVDTVKEDVDITIRNAGGTVVSILRSNASGLDTATLNDGADYSFTAFGPAGWVWAGESFTVIADSTDTIIGYNYLPGASPASTPTKSTIFGWATNAVGDSLYGATITAWYLECETSTAGDVAITSEPVVTSTNSNGYWQLSLVNSDEYDNSDCGFYMITGEYNSIIVFKTRRLWITGGFNVTDSIEARP